MNSDGRDAAVKILVCPDSYKEALSASAVAERVETGLTRASKRIQCDLAPMADGGEGTVDALCARGRRLQTHRVTGPVGAPVDARFGFLEDGETAVLEMAEAAGLQLLRPDERNPLAATTRGVGELILRALDCGAKRIIIGIGGSATNDGGAGMAWALGARLLDDHGEEIGHGGQALQNLARVDVSHLDPRIARTPIDVASDVRNPLTGDDGASAVYGPQKGASPAEVHLLDRALGRYAAVLRSDLGVDVEHAEGAGAAGGLGAGLLAFCGARILSGAGLIADAIRLPERMERADWVITGEGKTDASTLSGKVVCRVLELARQAKKPCVILSGAVTVDDSEPFYARGATALIAVADRPMNLEEALRRTPDLLELASCNLGRLMLAASNGGSG